MTEQTLDILDGAEQAHIVEFRDASFTVRHPLRERLHDAILDCDLEQYCSSMAGRRPIPVGRYWAKKTSDGRWRFVLCLITLDSL